MNQKEFCEQMEMLVADQARDPWQTVWIYAQVFRDGAVMGRGLYQPANARGTCRGFLIRGDASVRFRQIFREYHQGSNEPEESRWSTATFILQRGERGRVEFGFEDLEKVNLARLDTAWEQRYMDGLKFVPDDETPPPLPAPVEKGQPGADDPFSTLCQLLADQTPEDFSSLWGRCVVVDGAAEVALFYEPALMPGRVDRVALGSSEKAELARSFLALREFFRSQHPDPWVTATLILGGERGFESQFTYDALSAQDLAAFEREWEGRYLAGLTFKDQPLLRVEFNSLPDAFKTVLEVASERMQHKIAAHQALWGLGQTNNWTVNLDEGVIRFQRPDGVVATCPVQVVGSWAEKDEDWVWGWVNPSFPEASKAHAQAVRRYGSDHARPALTTGRLVCDEATAWRFTALAVQLNDAQCAYCGVTRTCKVFMTLGKVTLTKG